MKLCTVTASLLSASESLAARVFAKAGAQRGGHLRRVFPLFGGRDSASLESWPVPRASDDPRHQAAGRDGTCHGPLPSRRQRGGKLRNAIGRLLHPQPRRVH